MDYDTFFNKEPWLFQSYLIAHEKKMKHKAHEMELLSWLTGGYVTHSIGATFGKGQYPRVPVLMEDKTDTIVTEDTDETKLLKEYNEFLQWSKLFNQQKTKGEETK